MSITITTPPYLSEQAAAEYIESRFAYPKFKGANAAAADFRAGFDEGLRAAVKIAQTYDGTVMLDNQTVWEAIESEVSV